MRGHLKVYRSFFAHWLWSQERVYSQPEAFLDLLQLAAFAPTKRVVKGKLISLSLGELAASERFLELRWKWSRTKVRRFLEILKSDQMLDQRKDQGETVLILCNYKDFHDGEASKKTSNQTSDDTTPEPAANQRRTSGEPNKKKIKNLEEGKEKKNPQPPRGRTPSAQQLIEAIPCDWSEGYRKIASMWAQDKQGRGQAKQRIQSLKAWEVTLKRMADYPLNHLTEAVEKAIANGWQGWEHESTKKHRTNGNSRRTHSGQQGNAQESPEIRHL